MGHPLHPDVLDEVVDDLFLLAFCNPEDMAVLHVDDVRRVLVAVVQLELVDAEETRLFVGTAELPVLDVELFQPPLVDGFHDVLADARELADLLVGECMPTQEETDVFFQLLRDAVVLGLERDLLHVRMAAVRAEVLDVLELDAADAIADRKMLQRLLEALVMREPQEGQLRSSGTSNIPFMQKDLRPEGRSWLVVSVLWKPSSDEGIRRYSCSGDSSPKGRESCSN